jgi:hypothetical protein
MGVNDWHQLILLLAGWLLWPTVVFIRTRHVQGKTLAAALGSAFVALAVSTAFGILFTDAVSVSKYRWTASWVMPCGWIVIPLLWLLLAVVQARRVRRRG